MKRVLIILIVANYGCMPKTEESQHESLESKARYFYERNDYALAVKYFDTLISLNPSRGEYYYSRGFSYSQLSRIRRSRNDFIKAIEMNYRVSDSYHNLAIDASRNHEDSLALFYFKRLLAYSPEREAEVEPQIKMCQSQIEIQKTDAWKDFEEYLKRKNKRLQIDTTY